MNSRTTHIQAELKTTRQLLVRFAHAPCVKLTLRTRPEVPVTPHVGRVLRLQMDDVSRAAAA